MDINKKITILKKPHIYIRLSTVFIIITVFMALTLLACMGICVLRFMPVGEVVIIDSPYEHIDIMETVAIREGKDRWWTVDTDAIENDLMAQRQLLGKVNVYKSLPNKIVIDVEKSRSARWYIEISDTKYSLDSDLYIIEELRKTEGVTKLVLPEIKEALPRRAPKFGQSEDEVRETLKIIDIVRGSEIRSRLTELDVSNRTNIRMVIDNKYRVELGYSKDLAGKLIKINDMLEQEKVKNSEGGLLYIYNLEDGVGWDPN